MTALAWPIRIRWCADGPGCRICIAQTAAQIDQAHRTVWWDKPGAHPGSDVLARMAWANR